MSSLFGFYSSGGNVPALLEAKNKQKLFRIELRCKVKQERFSISPLSIIEPIPIDLKPSGGDIETEVTCNVSAI